VALRLLENDESIVQAVREGTLGELAEPGAVPPPELVQLEVN
jgi:hypothetical protein